MSLSRPSPQYFGLKLVAEVCTFSLCLCLLSCRSAPALVLESSFRVLVCNNYCSNSWFSCTVGYLTTYYCIYCNVGSRTCFLTLLSWVCYKFFQTDFDAKVDLQCLMITSRLHTYLCVVVLNVITLAAYLEIGRAIVSFTAQCSI